MGPSGGMVDAGDSKSPDGDIVPVRVRPWVPLNFWISLPSTKECNQELSLRILHGKRILINL